MVGERVGIDHRQFGQQRTGIGQRHAGGDALFQRQWIDGGNAQRTPHRLDTDERGVIRHGAGGLARQPVGRQERPPQRQMASAALRR